jgi:hypothetical protein
MDDFPEFMKCGANRIAPISQATPGVEGYVFDGADGGQMAFWTCRETASSAPHVHESCSSKSLPQQVIRER